MELSGRQRGFGGEAHEPVAVETELGWVISGPLTYSQSADKGQVVQVNFVGSDRVSPDSLDRNVQRLWDLETLRVTACDRVNEEFMESIFFNGARYSVKLPWKEGHGSLPSNYELSLSRMKSQIRKLRKESEVLEEYDAVIKDQLASGVIETVTELEKVDQVHCIPHLAVVLCTTLLQRLGRGRGGGEGSIPKRLLACWTIS